VEDLLYGCLPQDDLVLFAPRITLPHIYLPGYTHHIPFAALPPTIWLFTAQLVDAVSRYCGLLILVHRCCYAMPGYRSVTGWFYVTCYILRFRWLHTTYITTPQLITTDGTCRIPRTHYTPHAPHTYGRTPYTPHYSYGPNLWVTVEFYSSPPAHTPHPSRTFYTFYCSVQISYLPVTHYITLPLRLPRAHAVACDSCTILPPGVVPLIYPVGDGTFPLVATRPRCY